MGEGTTYLDWFNGDLDFGTEPRRTPSRRRAPWPRPCPTDRNCAESWAAGRKDFEGWLTSSTTVQAAIDEGLPVVAIGDPVYYEPLAAAFDKNVEDNDSLVAAVDAIIGEMHADGTLATLSQTVVRPGPHHASRRSSCRHLIREGGRGAPFTQPRSRHDRDR